MQIVLRVKNRINEFFFGKYAGDNKRLRREIKGKRRLRGEIKKCRMC